MSFGLWACIWERWSLENERLQRQWKNGCDSWPKTSKPPNHTAQARLQERSWLSSTASSPIETEHSLKCSSSSPWYQLCTRISPDRCPERKREKENRDGILNGKTNRSKNLCSVLVCVCLEIKESMSVSTGNWACNWSRTMWHLCCWHAWTNGKWTRWMSVKDNGFGFPELVFSFLRGCWICYEILVVDLMLIFSPVWSTTTIIFIKTKKNI